MLGNRARYQARKRDASLVRGMITDASTCTSWGPTEERCSAYIPAICQPCGRDVNDVPYIIAHRSHHLGD